MQQHPCLVQHLFERAVPDFCRAFTHLTLDILCRFIDGPAGLEGHAAAASDRGKANSISVPDRWADIGDREAKDFGAVLGG